MVTAHGHYTMEFFVVYFFFLKKKHVVGILTSRLLLHPSLCFQSTCLPLLPFSMSILLRCRRGHIRPFPLLRHGVPWYRGCIKIGEENSAKK